MRFSWNENKISLFNTYYSKITDKELSVMIGAKDHRTIEKYAKKIGNFQRKKLDKSGIEFILDNLGNYTVKELAKMFGKTEAAIRVHMRNNGIFGNTDNYIWDAENTGILRSNYSDKSWEYLFGVLGTNNKLVIMNKAQKLKLKRGFFFTEKEKQFLIDNYGKLTIENIASILGKQVDKVKRKATLLGLDNGYYHWTFPEIEMLKEKYSFHKNSDLVKMFFLGCSIKRISYKAESLGLKKQTNRIPRFNKDEVIKKLTEVAKNIGHTPTIYELKENGLPSSTTMTKYFGGYSQACILAGIDINIMDIYTKNRKAYLSKRGDICYSISEITISDFLYNHGIDYQKEVYYKDIV